MLDNENLKYNIEKYVTPELRKEIMQKLNISRGTFYNKCKAKIGENNGFEFCQVLQICDIINQRLDVVITPAAKKHYSQIETITQL